MPLFAFTTREILHFALKNAFELHIRQLLTS